MEALRVDVPAVWCVVFMMLLPSVDDMKLPDRQVNVNDKIANMAIYARCQAVLWLNGESGRQEYVVRIA